MSKGKIAILVSVGVLLLGTGIFFGATPIGRRIITGYNYDMEKAGENSYGNRKKVEETLRAYYASYKSDKASYEMYKDETDEYYYRLAQSHKQRANATAVAYNEYFTKNSYVFANNIPEDLPTKLELL